MVDFKKIDLVIFDLDGTLIDSAHDLASSLYLALQDEGLFQHTVQDLIAKIGVGSKNLLKELVNDDPIVEKRVFDYYIKRYSSNMFTNTKLFPFVPEILEKLTNKSVALVSNKREKPCVEILKHFQIDHHFKMTLGGDSLAQRKPHPAPLLHICNTLGISSEKTVMIGDSPVDIDAGIAAGTQTIGILEGLTPPDVMKKSNAHFLIPKVGDLLPLL